MTESRGTCFRSGAAIFIGMLLLAGSLAAQGWQHVGRVSKVEKLDDGIELTAGSAKVRLTSVNDGTVRVRYAADGKFPPDTDRHLGPVRLSGAGGGTRCLTRTARSCRIRRLACAPP